MPSLMKPVNLMKPFVRKPYHFRTYFNKLSVHCSFSIAIEFERAKNDVAFTSTSADYQVNPSSSLLSWPPSELVTEYEKDR